jgi:hypothetical protein
LSVQGLLDGAAGRTAALQRVLLAHIVPVRPYTRFSFPDHITQLASASPADNITVWATGAPP